MNDTVKRGAYIVLLLWSYAFVSCFAQAVGDTILLTREDGLKMRCVVLDNEKKTAELVSVMADKLYQIEIPTEAEGYKISKTDKRAFYYDQMLESIVLHDGVEDIPAFSYDENLRRVSLPSGIKEIQPFLFFMNKALESVKMPDCVEAIGDCSFDGCNSLHLEKIPDSLKYIGQLAFVGCTSLEQVRLPEGLYHIGDMAFYRCDIRVLSLPSSLKEIGYFAFALSDSLQQVSSYINLPMNIHKTVFGHWLALLLDGYYPDKYEYVWIDDIWGGHDYPVMGRETVYPTATLRVLKGTKAQYEATPEWNRFAHIVEMDDTGISSSLATRHSPTIYDLQGRRLTTEPQRGIYIQDGKKVLTVK